MISSLSNRALVAYLILSDAAIFGGGVWLERFSLSAAADPKTSALLILALLAANFVLLLLLLGAVGAATVGIARLGQALARVSGGKRRVRYL
jgi:hypothetical protein